MAGLSQSAFLQALGWATLNSFWQMALLWCIFLVANYFFKLSAQKKYYLAAISIIGGGSWFFGTFILFYYNSNASYNLSFAQYSLSSLKNLTPIVLASASITYLALLFIPAYKLFYNWRSIQLLRKKGLQKAEIQYKLFIKKIAKCLGIKKNVGVYFSELVKSPLTIGYLKPIILLPIASINNLTTQQVEAVLLHELSHIKRYDYLVNIFISVIQTFLYFNPFTRLFVRVVQEERENCCDQMVLQFGYDRVSYASALLSLEKTSLQSHTLVLRAAGKRNLLSRVEKIIGVEKKIGFRFHHLAGLIAGLLCIFTFNSLLIITKDKNALALSFNSLENPFYFFGEKEESTPLNSIKKSTQNVHLIAITKKPVRELNLNTVAYFAPESIAVPQPPELIPVVFNEPVANLSEEEKTHIKTTIANTKKVLSNYQWKNIEKTIGDDLTAQEKVAIKKEYLREVNKIDWEDIEKDLKATYENINWQEVDGNLQNALVSIQLDSLQFSYKETLNAIEKVQAEIQSASKPALLPFPDASLAEVKKQEEKLRTNLKEIKLIRIKKVIKL